MISWQNHPVLKELPVFVNNLDDLKKIAETITFSKRFPGINDLKFDVVVRKHKGGFYDHSGMYYTLMQQFNVSIAFSDILGFVVRSGQINSQFIVTARMGFQE